eukprot:scaffold584096_cov47-Prasinocladus_malaysianus.AAC.1
MGRRMYMEDRQLAVPDLKSLMKDGPIPADELPQTRAFFGVFDGHGGESAAQYTADHLLTHILQDSRFPNEIDKAM